ncbi:CHAT domain-containing protein [Prosthecobacter sp.]|uniref:nSTAND1 domain-containing NTPase n=1 Tax=Prosthecobacter sp. TaxID=1965333 RepID=UPI003783DE78
MSRPFLFFAFANDRTDEDSFLRNLTEEQKAIEAVLPPEFPACSVRYCPGATVAEVFDAFQKIEVRGRIALLHFAGHADGQDLILEQAGRQIAPADSEGLAEFLGAQQGLQVVFLNACATRPIADALIKKGVPAVIATSRAINDEVASLFAARFYNGLAAGCTVTESFNAAASEMRTRYSATKEEAYRKKDDQGHRFRGCETEIRILEENHEWPWRLLKAEGPEGERAGQWSLALHDPLLGVPPLPPGLAPPPRDLSPFRVLAWFQAADAKIFFGRGRAIRELWQAIEDPHRGIVLLHGPSGSGKSSLLEAGLLPRVRQRTKGGSHQVICLRRSKGAGLAGDLQAALQKLAGREGDVSTLWRACEEGGAPLLVILDQAEETFTRPREDPEQEWRDFLNALVPLFGESVQLPLGKLILSFRKEWYPEIEKRLRSLTNSFGAQFLAPLDRDGIVEAVEGAANDASLQAHYQHRIEAGLAARIADDLLKDRDSAIAPMLEVLLFDLWKAAGAEAAQTGNVERRFTLALYEPLQRRGTSLRSFLYRQLEQLGAGMSADMGKSACGTGLALDVLAFHTTPLGTAERRNRKELAAAYQHVEGAVLEALLNGLDALSLLVQPAGATDTVQRVTRLSHDSLAPLVREAFDKSELPGQRARRILETRVRDAAAQADLPDNADAKVADEQLAAWITKNRDAAALEKLDYATVRGGRQGMRQGGAAEAAVLEVSEAADRARKEADSARNEAERRQQRVVKMAIIGGIAALILIVSLTLLALSREKARALENLQQRSLESYGTALRSMVNNKEREASAYLLHSLRIWPQNRLAADRLYGLMTQRNFALPLFGPVKGLDTISSGTGFQLGVSKTGTARLLADGNLAEFRELREDGKMTHELNAFLAAKGLADFRPSSRAKLTADGRWLADCKNDYQKSTLQVVDLDTGKMFQREVPGTVGELAFIPSEGLLMALNAPVPPVIIPATPPPDEKEKEKKAEEKGDEDDDRPDPPPDMTNLLVWRFAGTEFVESTPNLGGAALPESLLAIYPYPDGKRVAVTTNVVTGKGPYDRQTQLRVFDLNLQTLSLRAISGLRPVTVDALAIPAFTHDTSVMVFPKGDEVGGSYLRPLEISQTGDWELSQMWAQPAGSEWVSDGRAYCWPGTNLHVLFGPDRIALARMDTLVSTPNALIPAAITPRMEGFGIGLNQLLLGRKRHPMPLDQLSEAVFDDYSIFDARQGTAMPEIKTLGTRGPDRPEQPNVTSKLVARRDSPRLDVMAHFNATKDGFFRVGVQLQKDGENPVPMVADFGFAFDENCVSAKISPNGKFLAMVVRAVSNDAALYVMDLSDYKLLVKGDALGADSMYGRLGGFEEAAAICFGADESIVCLVDRKGHLLLWDWRRRLPMSDVLGCVGFATSFSDGLTISDLQWQDGKVTFVMDHHQKQKRVTYCVGFPRGVPKDLTRLTELVTLITGMDADANGNLISLPEPEEPRGYLLKKLRESYAAATGDADELAFCRWFLEDRATRPVFPGATQTVSDLFEAFLSAGQFDEASLLTFEDEAKVTRVRNARKTAAETKAGN